jgi:hypothetical protein
MCTRRALAVEEHPGRSRADVELGHPEGGERRREQTGNHYVIKPHHAMSSGTFEPNSAQALKASTAMVSLFTQIRFLPLTCTVS